MDDVYVVISGASRGSATLTSLDDSGIAHPDEPATTLDGDDLVEAVEALELENPRWVWADTAPQYGWLLAHGVRVDRCHDLRLTRAILRSSALTEGSALAASPRGEFDGPAPFTSLSGPEGSSATADRNAGPVPFDFEGGIPSLSSRARASSAATASSPATASSAATASSPAMPATPPGASDDERLAERTVAELVLQLDAIRTSTEPNRLRLLVAAESAGALVAAEMSHAGLPWREDVHDQLLTELLGPQVEPGRRPARLEALAQAVRRALGAPQLNPDSPQELLRALRAAGLAVTSTRSWELQGIEHPVVPPLLEYKKLSRLLSANGWSWMESWVTNGRFFPDYVPGGVVSGRWATRGGGALQLPKQVRRAVTADDGWTLVVADAAQLEPRILAGISADTTMAAAGQGKDLYAGIVESGAVKTRAEAKVAMLGAMYGATTGESGRLLPRLGRAFPTALSYVENAARAGERGEVVTSRLGRSAPRPPEAWSETQALAREGSPNEAAQQQARREARDWGRFTRNFVVQASAADWALCWLADLRRRLAALAPADADLADADVNASDTTSDDEMVATADTDTQVDELAADQRAGGWAPGGGGDTEATDEPAATAHTDAASATSPAPATGPGSAIDPTSADVADLSPADREAARVAAIEAEIAERERRKAADSPFKAADPVAAMAARLAELRSAGQSVRPVTAPAAASRPATVVAPAAMSRPVTAAAAEGTARTPVTAPTATLRTALPTAAASAGQYPATGTLGSPAAHAPFAATTVTTAATATATATVDAAGSVPATIVPGRAKPPFRHAPHLVFFLHDEVIVHAPAALAEEVADAIRESAAAATRLLFGRFPLDVPLDISIVDSYADAD
ncbi:bifunctional 3'-5' exonuclease/DNA polymerase [Subtercola boreus]|uniref:bifunctional 3'-5' exonuclease/DNA polymerase n=1 Tax=Subtercola boreus TaxID=120213 RepID=UPI00209BF6AE|nr:bifunctional 3'-5' exonuclease/DNA polymerase [Subtercola boreus]